MRMDKQLPLEERMTIETIDRMISGRVRNYSAPKQYEFDADRQGRIGLASSNSLPTPTSATNNGAVRSVVPWATRA